MAFFTPDRGRVYSGIMSVFFMSRTNSSSADGNCGNDFSYCFGHFSAGPRQPCFGERPDYYSHRRSLFALSQVGPAPIVMLGDSLTEEGPWHELSGCPWIVNRAIKGDAAARVHACLDDVPGLRPKAVFFMIGVSDVVRGIAPASIAANIRTILDVLDGSGLPSYVLPVTELLLRNAEW
jgi:hypothetical protein